MIILILGAVIGGLITLVVLFCIANRIEPPSEIEQADAIFERARRQMNRVSQRADGFDLGPPPGVREQR